MRLLRHLPDTYISSYPVFSVSQVCTTIWWTESRATLPIVYSVSILVLLWEEFQSDLNLKNNKKTQNTSYVIKCFILWLLKQNVTNQV